MSNPKVLLLSLIWAFCLFIQMSSAQNNAPFPQSLIKEMASRQMRYHHFLWHQIRDNWNKFSSSTKKAFRDIGWDTPNPRRYSNGDVINNNNAGEDFLYMHRQMIATANQIIAQNNEPYGPIRGWTTIPAPGDSQYPVPPPYRRGSESKSASSWKTDNYYYNNIKPLEQSLKDPAKLRKMTLSQLGTKIETGIHSAMHMRWSTGSPMGFRSGGIGTNVPNVNKKWDDPEYDFLGDTYSSHVNPIFWKLHGWIDDRIEDWRKANGLSSIRWKSTWTGGPMSSLGSVLKKRAGNMKNDPEEVGDLLQKGFEIFAKSGVAALSFEDIAKMDLAQQKSQKTKLRNCRKVKSTRRSN